VKAIWSSIYGWMDERLGLADLAEFAAKKTVPAHRQSAWYYWGGIAVFFFLVQAVTGVLLLLYYRPGPDSYESVRTITYEVNFGWLVRSIHSWGANLMVAAVFVHMFSTFFMKAYRKPREFGWWSGVVLLLLTMVFGFSGYLLPMDELAFCATKVGLEISSALPRLGPAMADLVRGGPEISQFTVQRFFTLHVVLLPVAFSLLLAFHLWLVQKHGNALPPSEEDKPRSQRRSIPFFPNFLVRDFAVWLIAFNILSVLAFLYPWDLGPQADPLKSAPAGIHPEWYFMSSFQVLKIFGTLFPGAAGEVIGMLLFTAGLVLWMLVPLYDGSRKSGRRAIVATWFGLFALAVLVVTTIWGYGAL
jgi:quinol-cytochrome oxidoreductase complex cytochrome b subunit